MNADWMSLFIAATVGAALSWTFCSMWAVRMIDRVKRQLRDENQHIKDIQEGQARYIQQQQDIEKLFNQTRM